jgi:hypothetical protein
MWRALTCACCVDAARCTQGVVMYTSVRQYYITEFQYLLRWCFTLGVSCVMATSPSDVHQCATCASVLYNRIPVLVALMLHVGGDVCDGYITSDVHQYYITEFQYMSLSFQYSSQSVTVHTKGSYLTPFTTILRYKKVDVLGMFWFGSLYLFSGRYCKKVHAFKWWKGKWCTGGVVTHYREVKL